MATRRKVPQAEFVCHRCASVAHRPASENAGRSEGLKRIAVARRASGLVRDLIAVRAPEAARRDASMEVARLAQLIAAGRISITEARAQLRGAA